MIPMKYSTDKLWQNSHKELTHRRLIKDVLRSCNDLHISFVALPNADSSSGLVKYENYITNGVYQIKSLLLPSNPDESD